MQYVSKYIFASLLLGTGFAASADKIHDPTSPKFQVDAVNVATSANSQTTDQVLKLQGIVNRKGSRMAIIDGDLYQVNDEINGFKISLIEQASVVLTKSGAQRRLYVYE